MSRCLICRLALGFVILAPSLLSADDDKNLRLSEAEKVLLELTNKERARQELSALEPDPILFRVARAHSANMARKGEMKHDLDGKNPARRVDEAGYDYRVVAENIAFSDGLHLKEIIKGWMESKHHRDNILDPRYRQIGLGIGRNDKDEVYYTQVFATPRKKR